MTDVQALRELIETERVRFEVPGCAVAVVIDGEVVLAEGFGTRDLETGAPVTGQTLFPIASDTKCFTAAALCQLADDGVLDLDAPVRSYLPWFEMSDPHATALVSARDLLSHRTGLPRHDFVWYGNVDLTLESIVRSLKHLPLNKQVRQTWQYNNLAFDTAGFLTEHLTGQVWEDVIRSRFFEPLGMKSTTFTADDWSAGDAATPYNKVDGELTAMGLPARSKLAPPGGIVSNAEDMGRWLLARLGREVDGNEVLTPGALTQLHTPAMIGGVGMGDHPERQPMGYALGCQVESYRGTRIVRHGGNLIGYSSDVCVVPGLNAAVVLLSNLHGTALRDALALMVIDQVLGLEPQPWGERYHAIMTAGLEGKAAAAAHSAASAQGRPASRPVEEFAGTYEHPAYGTLTLTVDGDGLDLDFHGLGDDLVVSHRDRDVFDVTLVELGMTIPLVFSYGPDGEVTGLSLPLEMLTPAITFTRAAPAVTPGLLDVIEGTYSYGPTKVAVRVLNGEVVVSTAGMKLPLVPAGGSAFTTPSMSTMRVEFVLTADGDVDRLVVEPLGVFTRD